MSDPGVHPAGSSSLPPHGLPPRSRTPPPLRAVAMPLDPQVLNPDTDFSLDLVKVQFKCTYATSFGQELRLVGGAPELGAWDVAQVRTGQDCTTAADAAAAAAALDLVPVSSSSLENTGGPVPRTLATPPSPLFPSLARSCSLCATSPKTRRRRP
jgi:hypothetical protein